MSALDRPKIEDAWRVITDAEKALSDICQGRRKFEMCVPVQNTDTDIVIGNAIFIARQLLAENAQLRAERDAASGEAARLREALEAARDYLPDRSSLPKVETRVGKLIDLIDAALEVKP